MSLHIIYDENIVCSNCGKNEKKSSSILIEYYRKSSLQERKI